MIRINLDWWCRVAYALRDLRDIKEGDAFPDFYKKAFPAIILISSNYADSSFFRLPFSSNAANSLVTAFQTLTIDTTRTQPLSVDEVASFQKAVADYQIVLAAELQAVDAYYVKAKGIYSTRSLIENAELILPE